MYLIFLRSNQFLMCDIGKSEDMWWPQSPLIGCASVSRLNRVSCASRHFTARINDAQDISKPACVASACDHQHSD